MHASFLHRPVQGRSRAFINDIPVQLNVLKNFTSQLIHIHSQYNTLELKDLNFQLLVLDVLAGIKEEREAFSIKMNDYLWKKRGLNEKKELLKNSLSHQDYNSFQLNELNELQLESTNYQEIETKTKLGENAEEIKKA